MRMERERSHEALYRRTIDSFVRNARNRSFTDEAVPGLVAQLRAELGQCVELGLIGSEFYSERMDVLARVLDAVEV